MEVIDGFLFWWKPTDTISGITMSEDLKDYVVVHNSSDTFSTVILCHTFYGYLLLDPSGCQIGCKRILKIIWMEVILVWCVSGLFCVGRNFGFIVIDLSHSTVCSMTFHRENMHPNTANEDIKHCS